MQKTILFLTVLFLCFAGSLSAQVTAHEAALAMFRGINLGNTLEPPNEGDWNNNVASESNFQAYVDAGFTNVRVPVRWDMHTGRSAPYTIDAAWMNRVEQVIDWGLERGLYVTINGHHEDWLKQNYSATNKARYDAIWRQIIARFKNKSEKLLYEIINEPKGLSVAQVDDLNRRIYDIIRAEEPTRIVIFGGNEWSNINELINADLINRNDPYLMGYYHSYDPWPFAGEHQGTWGSPADYQNMRNIFQRAVNWTNTSGMPVYISEFNARVEADFNSRMRWLAEYVGLADQYKLPFSVWDDNGWFKVLNRNNSTWPETKDIFIHYYQDSPNQIFSEATSAPGNSDAPAAKVTWNNRMTDNGEIVVERRRANSAWSVVGTLPADATEFIDTDVFLNNDYDYRIRTTRPDGTLVHGYPTRVRIVSTVQAAYNDAPQTIPGILEVEDYDNGGQGVAYNDSDPANQGGGYRLNEGVDIGADATGFVLGYVSNGEWLEFTVNVTQAGTYTATSSVASADAPSAFAIKKGEQTLTTFSTPLTNGWSTFQTIDANQEFVLEAGEQVIRLEITGNSAFNIDLVTFDLLTSVEDEANLAGFTVSPNPADTQMLISLPAALVGANSNLQLFNAAGAKVLELDVTSELTELNVAQLPAGSYALRFTDGQKSLVRRVVIR